MVLVNEIIESNPSLPILSENGSFGSDIEESTKWWKEVNAMKMAFEKQFEF